jgi:hypothetical protein
VRSPKQLAGTYARRRWCGSVTLATPRPIELTSHTVFMPGAHGSAATWCGIRSWKVPFAKAGSLPKKMRTGAPQKFLIMNAPSLGGGGICPRTYLGAGTSTGKQPVSADSATPLHKAVRSQNA